MMHSALHIKIIQLKALLSSSLLWLLMAFMTYNFTQKYVNVENLDATELCEEDGEKESKEIEVDEKDDIYLNYFDYFVGVDEFTILVDRYLYKRYDSDSDITTPPPEVFYSILSF